MTEAEALKKWCPFAKSRTIEFVSKDGGRETSRITTGDKITVSCIGSACMAWRGKEQPWFTNRAEAEFRRTGRRLEPAGADIDGFCGLAGAPQ